MENPRKDDPLALTLAILLTLALALHGLVLGAC
jgi:hypothetical protein